MNNNQTYFLKLESIIITVSLFILIWLSSLYFGAPVSSTELDQSWLQGLGYAFKQHWQAGIDYVFTFGPLGYLSHPTTPYDSDLFYLVVSWQIISGFCFALIFLLMASTLPSKIDKFIYFSLVVILLSAFAYDARYHLGMVAITLLLISRWSVLNTQPFFRDLSVVAWLLFLATISLTKFSYFILILAAIFSVSVVVGWRSSRLAALLIPITFGAMVIGIWLMAGQSLTNLPTFLQTSLAITNGYSEAMVIGYNLTEIKLAIGISLLITGLTITFAWSKPFQLERGLISSLILLDLFLVWKAGFVRHDTHSLIFFTVTTVIPFLIQIDKERTAVAQWIFYTLRYLTVVLALGGLLFTGLAIDYTPRTFIGNWNQRLVDNYKMLTHLTQYKQNQDKFVVASKQQHDLPKIRVQVGNATVDTFSYEQGVLLLNGFNWQPRPVFQSYLAYTPSLLALNGNFFAQSRAPAFVIFKLPEIDSRFPMASDSEVLKILFRDYQPVLVEKGYLLLQRAPRGQGRVTNGRVLWTHSVKLNEELAVNQQGESKSSYLVSIDLRQSWLGRLAKLFYRLPMVRLELETTAGEQLSYRIIPQMVQNSFLLNPLILDQHDVIRWYDQLGLKRVAKLRVVVMPTWLHRFFQPAVTVTAHEFTITPPVLESTIEQKIPRKLYPMLQSKPYQVSMPHQDMLEGGQSVLMVHAPGEIQFRVMAGTHTLKGQFGLIENAYQNKQICPYLSDGIEFKVVLQPLEGAPQILFNRFLNPQTVITDRGFQKLPDLSFTAPGKEAMLLLLTQPGPADNAQCDWSFWQGIKVE